MELLGGFNPRAPYGARPRMSARSHGISSFNPRAPYGARPMRAAPTLQSRCFNPRASARLLELSCFNPRAPYGARLATYLPPEHTEEFQSTRPVRGATYDDWRAVYVDKFQSTRPVRGATNGGITAQPQIDVSIHAPRTGRDQRRDHSTAADRCFNPRAPYGARPVKDEAFAALKPFQSTRPVRGATVPAPHGFPA